MIRDKVARIDYGNRKSGGEKKKGERKRKWGERKEMMKKVSNRGTNGRCRKENIAFHSPEVADLRPEI
jgi:hypothetical protein